MKKYLLVTLLLAAMSSTNAVATVKIVGLYGTTYCAGATFPLVVQATGVYIQDNIFLAQLSDSTGVFNANNNIFIGADTAWERGYDTIMVTIPLNTPSGSHYRIRIVTTDPQVISADNGENLTIQPTPPAPVLSLGSGCPDTLYISGQGNPYSITWRQELISCDCQDSTFPSVYTPSVAVGGIASNPVSDPQGAFVYGGYYYVPEWSGGRVQRFPVGSDSATIGVTVAGGNGGGTGSNQFNGPSAVFVDGNGYLYVADYSNGRIQMFPPGSTSATNGVTVAGGNGLGNGPNQLWFPQSIFVDACGNLYVADYDNARVQKFPAGSTSATNGVTVAGGNGNGSAANQVSFPYGIFVDGEGYIYVADGGSNRIQKFPPNSDSTTDGVTVAGGNGNGNAANQMFPSGIWVDAAGNMYVADGGNNRMMIFPPWSTSATNGVILGNGQGSNVDQMQGPIGMFVDSAGNIYVPDAGNGRVIVWTPTPSPTAYFPNAPVANVYGAQYTTWAGCWSEVSNYDTLQVCDGINTITLQNNLSLYPNPNNGSFVLQSSDAIGEEYIINDMLGRVVVQQTITSNNQNIELQNISAGTYMLSVKGSNSRAVRFSLE